MTQTRAVIFDFGGTLFTYESAIQSRSGRARKLAGWLGLDDAELGAVVQAVRDGMARSSSIHFARPYYLHRDMFRDAGHFAAVALGGRLSPEQLDEWMALTGAATATPVPRPGMAETLAELRRRGLHVGSASNADIEQFEAMVDGLDVRAAFDSLLCSEEARSCKPDLAIYEEALRRAGCAPHEALFVGDTPDHDLVGAERAGMRGVLIEETSPLAFDRGRPKPGQLTIRELPELLNLVG